MYHRMPFAGGAISVWESRGHTTLVALTGSSLQVTFGSLQLVFDRGDLLRVAFELMLQYLVMRPERRQLLFHVCDPSTVLGHGLAFRDRPSCVSFCLGGRMDGFKSRLSARSSSAAG